MALEQLLGALDRFRVVSTFDDLRDAADRTAL
jgi:hypothetical protein